MKKYILSFLIPISILLLSFLYNDFFSKSILISDLSAQYYHFFYKFIEILNGEGNLLYTFDFGLGASMYSIFSYYLVSITNVFLFFFSFENLYIYIYLIIIVKIGLCGLTMYKFLQYNFKNNYLLIFSTAYALSTFILSNYFQIMWLDNYVLAPLVFLGIDKIIKDNNFILYSLTLFLAILSNYYIGGILCIFSVIYYIYKSLIKYGKLKKFLKFLVVSCLSGMMTMFVHFLTLKEIIQLNRINSFETGFNTDFAKVISGFFIGNEMESVISFTYPKLYVGILILFLLFLYFFNNKISKKEKIFSLMILILFLLIIIFKPLNVVFHVFITPTGFNFRYIYLINIFIIFISCRCFENIVGVHKIYYIMFIYIFLIFCFIVLVTDRNSINFVLLSLIFVVIYFLIFYFFKNKGIVLIFLLEIFINSIYVYNNFTPLNSVDEIIDYKLFNIINEIKGNDMSPFYRMDFINLNIKTNDNLLYGYKSASSWVSTIKYNELNFLKNISYNVGLNSYHFKSNDIMNALLGIKYYATENSNDQLINKYNNMNIYKNENALNIGFLVNSKSKEKLVCDSSYKCSENILNMMTNDESEIYEELKMTQLDNYNFEFTIDNNQDFYIYFESKYASEPKLKIFINDTLINDSGGYFYDIDNVIKIDGMLENKYEIGDKIKIKIIDENNSLYDIKLKIYNYNYNLFLKKINQLKNKQLYLLEFKDNYIKATSEGKGTLFFSIPYNENWKVYIDGKKSKTYKLFDMFLGVDIDEGNHIVELKYESNDLKTGLIISIISMFALIVYIYSEKTLQ